jgi:hypothetical protein
MTEGTTQAQRVETGRAPPHPLEYLEELERAFASSRQWQEVFLGCRRFG